MRTYQKFKALPIDHAAIGLEQSDTHVTYYCTPKDAEIIGWAGVDGIHYCTIPEFGEMIFAVSPMNLGDCVHPIARNFEDLLRLLLCCGDMAALEQCYAWNEEQFKAFLTDYPVTQEQQAVLDVIRKEFDLEPMEDAFAYVKKLQSEFDVSRIPYTEDYYDPEMNAAAPARPAEWKVTYDGGFWDHDGNAGREVAIGKTFYWGSERWYIPAVYICDKGLVIDFLMEADPAQVKAFIDKWDLMNEDRHNYTEEQQEQIRREHPLNVDFYGTVTCNGQKLRCDHGCGLSWLTDDCLPRGSCPDAEAQYVLVHYGLDLNRAWSIHRNAFPWGDGNGQDIQSLSIHMARRPENMAGPHFFIPAVGERVSFGHPLTGKTFTLTVHEVQQQELPEHAFQDPSMAYPTHFTVMSYSLEPDITGRGFTLQDCADGDRPRQKNRDPNAFEPVVCAGAAAIGVIGGADGPTAIILGQNTPKLHTACSALHFEPVDEVEWRTVFSEKMMPDVDVCLL